MIKRDKSYWEKDNYYFLKYVNGLVFRQGDLRLKQHLCWKGGSSS